MSLISVFKGVGASGFGYGSSAEDVTAGLSLEGKTILVTGCNSGLGLETMRVLALRGAHVFGTARSEDKAMRAAQSVPGRATGLACELADPKSVRACVKALLDRGVRLDAIVANAGVMAMPKLETAFGYDLQFFTNHIGHFMLVTGLLDALTSDGRIVMVSSNAHFNAPSGGIDFDNLDGSRGYRPWSFYGQSKIANLLFAVELSRRFAGTLKTANAVHPGVIKTNLVRHMNPIAALGLAVGGPLLLKSIPEGAATQCYVAVHPGAAKITGEYFSDCNIAKCRREAKDPALAKKLWERSEEIVAALPF